MDFFTEWPFPVAVAALFAIVCLRAGGTYLVGRGIRRGAGASRLRRLVETPAYQGAERVVARWGAPAVVLCFLTVGVQTMVNLAAGAGHMPLRRYLPALGVGGLLWALAYATVGSVTWAALALLYARHPVAAVLVGVMVLAGIVGFVASRLRTRRRRRSEDAVDLPELTHTPS